MNSYAPDWAKNSYLEIISYIKSIFWNRKLQWSVSPACSIPNYNEGTDSLILHEFKNKHPRGICEGGTTEFATRIYGVNRYETSIKVAQQLDKSTEIAVATGEDFPDAISISSIAAQKGMPILLTGKNNLPSGIAQY
ncbi:cell wall-binding repeat-containing protein [Clostridium bowmanii]|uniref:cell wall-binding repeat-containing protein n=1 Tax=Clostridium bowmanii TaxID=132925 RepID=UPI001C0E8BD4|nr:cell wall-binding repeat-containing protein [Clostridium bowmanii]MBU3191508.1 cell wall-binding repeat-containing protein [Clostridium bowmanii]MCA1075896.1 cell wall-binding repeat-containing protein [Clostridium bowmanii]